MKKMSTKAFLDQLIASGGLCPGTYGTYGTDVMECEEECPIGKLVGETCTRADALAAAKKHYDELVDKEQEEKLDMRSRACTGANCDKCDSAWECLMEGKTVNSKPREEKQPKIDAEQPKLLLHFDGPTPQELLATDHWQYVKGLMENAGIKGEQLNLLAYMYKTAFIHGWKHAKEDNA